VIVWYITESEQWVKVGAGLGGQNTTVVDTSDIRHGHCKSDAYEIELHWMLVAMCRLSFSGWYVVIVNMKSNYPYEASPFPSLSTVPLSPMRRLELLDSRGCHLVRRLRCRRPGGNANTARIVRPNLPKGPSEPCGPISAQA